MKCSRKRFRVKAGDAACVCYSDSSGCHVVVLVFTPLLPPLLPRGALRRRPALAAATLPCLRSTPLQPPTPSKAKARQHL